MQHCHADMHTPDNPTLLTLIHVHTRLRCDAIAMRCDAMRGDVMRWDATVTLQLHTSVAYANVPTCHHVSTPEVEPTQRVSKQHSTRWRNTVVRCWSPYTRATACSHAEMNQSLDPVNEISGVEARTRFMWASVDEHFIYTPSSPLVPRFPPMRA